MTSQHLMTHAICDVLVIGAGPAGMAAALAAAEGGAQVLVIDDNPLPGGQIWRDGPGASLPPVAQKHRDALAGHANIRVCSGARVVDAPAPHELLIEDATSAWRQPWKKLILCTGARELLLPFPGWTLPGVTGAGALQALIKAGLPVAGERIVIAGSGPLLLAAAASAKHAGATVLRVAEQAPLSSLAGFAMQLVRWPAKAVQAVTLLDKSFRTGSHVLSASGNLRLTSVRLQRGNDVETIDCDRLACGFGLVPNTGLAQFLGCDLSTRAGSAAVTVDAWQATSLAHVYAAGECTGVGGSERALAQGRIAGHAAAGQMERAKSGRLELYRWQAFADALHERFKLSDKLKTLAKSDTLICRCEDVALSQLTARTSWTDAKLHTRCGMGACQGRVCGAATQFIFGWTPPAPRPPLSPVRLSTLAMSAPPSTPSPDSSP